MFSKKWLKKLLQVTHSHLRCAEIKKSVPEIRIAQMRC